MRAKDDSWHIRDILQMDRHTAEIPNRTLCGQGSDDVRDFVFADPRVVLKRQGNHPFCEKCRQAWISERDSDKEFRQFMHFMRIQLHAMLMRGAAVKPVVITGEDFHAGRLG